MRLDCFSKPLGALALCFCLLLGGFAAQNVGAYDKEDSTTAQAQAQTQVLSLEQDLVLASTPNVLVPSDVTTSDGFDLDEEVSGSLNISAVTGEVKLDASLAWLFDFNADEQAKPKPSNQPQNDNGDPWSEVSNFFKQYRTS